MKGKDSDSQDIHKSLYKISKAVIDTIDLPDLYKTIHATIQELMPAENFYIAIYEEETETVSFPYYIDQHDLPPEPRKLGKGLTDYVIRSKEPLLIDEDIEDHLKGSQIDFDIYGSPSQVWLGIPLKINDKVLGVMVVQDYDSKFAYTVEDKRVLSFVSEQAALAINKKRDEEALKKYMYELEENRKLLEDKTLELSKLNEELAESEIKLQQLNANKDRLFSIISHDLRSPFASVLGFMEYMSTDYDNITDEERKNYLIQINASAKNVFNLLENLLKWSQMQMGNMDVRPIYIDMCEVISETIKVLRANAVRKQVLLNSTAKSGSVVYADHNMISSVMLNLVSNAIKFTRKGDTITILTNNFNDYIEVVVEDTGVGIDPVDLRKIFDVGVRHSTKGTDNEPGTGLGLTLCNDLIRKNGGELRAYSDGVKGSRFSFSLPKRNNN